MAGNAGGEATVGRVVGLWRYPVKSMGPEPLEAIDVSWHGVVGDRRWAFVREGLEQSGFPWLTLRQNADLSRYRPFIVEPESPDTSPTLVETPSGSRLDVTDPALARELWPAGARVIRQNRGVFDTFPLSLITTQSVAQLGRRVNVPLQVQRFRPNLLVEAGDMPFPEDDWVGKVIRVGSLRMRVDKRDGRCV
ncbi:MAG: MOSC domain-containing protein, partial [Gemmatimonadetes bacterium]|nr:MOSC domain-containing protein [Gemmatimonadota bacterium]